MNVFRYDVVKKYYLSMIAVGNATKRLYVVHELERHQHQQTN